MLIVKRKLVVCSVGLFLCVVAHGVADHAAGTTDPSTTLNRLSTGSAQMVLSVVTMALAGAVLYLAKKLMAIQDARIDQANKARDEFSKIVIDNTLSQERLAASIDDLNVMTGTGSGSPAGS